MHGKASAAVRGKLGSDLAAVQLHDLVADIQPQPQAAQVAIDARYASDASLRESLGAAVGGERYGKGYAFQEYANGRLYWSDATGVFMRLMILQRPGISNPTCR
mgnify:CR=1 FL=1